MNTSISRSVRLIQSRLSNSEWSNKDWERLSHSGRYDMNRLKVAMMLLIANDEPLPPEYLDHELSGEWSGFRECHIGGNFLLIYDLHADGSIIFTRTGTHADLFE